MKLNFFYPELSYQITGILFSVHNEIGSFGREVQYAHLFEEKLKIAKIEYQREYRVSNTGNIVDFVINDTILVELKAKRTLTKEDYEQVKRYLHATELQLGLLVNFKEKYLKPRRILHPKHL